MSDTDKHTRRQAKELFDEAQALLQHGDYAQAGTRLAQVITLAPDSDISQKAVVAQQALALDPWAIHAGAGLVVLLGLAWLVSVG